jgi:hypothetical protein
MGGRPGRILVRAGGFRALDTGSYFAAAPPDAPEQYVSERSLAQGPAGDNSRTTEIMLYILVGVGLGIFLWLATQMSARRD